MIKTPLSTVIGGAFWTPGCTVIGGNTPTFDQQIQKLFTNGEQGFAYDPNDLTTMFQGAAGTIPVTGAGQPVGLMLDKSKGLMMGGELNPNITFSADLSGWAIGTNVSATHSNGEAVVTFGGPLTSSGVNWFSLHSPVALGDRVVIEFDATYVSGGNLQVGSSYTLGATIFSAENGGNKKRYKVEVTCLIPAFDRVANFAAPAGSVWKIDNVSVKKIAGNHAYQTTSASRPILRQNAVTGAYYLEFDGTDDSLETSNIDFTGTDKVSLFAGVRKLSDIGSAVIVELSHVSGNNAGTFALWAPLTALANFAAFSRGTSSSNVITPQTWSSPVSAVLAQKAGISSDLNSLKINGTQIQVSTDLGTGNFGNYPLFIGRRGGTTLPFNGHIYGLIGIGKLTSDAETIALEKSIAKNTGVTLSV